MAAIKLSTVFLDANILADLYLKRTRFPVVSQLLTRLDAQVTISILSVEICSYIARREAGLGLHELESFIAEFSVLDVTNSTLLKAFEVAKDDDLEDALQVACALENKADLLLTADKKLAERYGKVLKIQLIV